VATTNWGQPLSFPIIYGLYELKANGKRNGIALLGIISVLLNGGIGLLEIGPEWLAIKEADPLIRKMLFNPTIMNIDKIETTLGNNGNTREFENRLDKANYFFAGTFLFSAIMNFILAKMIVTSRGGTSAFNEELGRMTLLSYPVIAIPSMIMLLGIFWYIWRTVSRLTGLTFEEIMVTNEDA